MPHHVCFVATNRLISIKSGLKRISPRELRVTGGVVSLSVHCCTKAEQPRNYPAKGCKVFASNF